MRQYSSESMWYPGRPPPQDLRRVVVIDRAKSVTDAAPLQACIGAVWGMETLTPRASYDILQSVW